jgi:ribosomal protein S18 acetylase RimI-like enzyme
VTETQIRPETLADCDETAALHVLAWQVGYRGMLPGEVLDNLDVRDWAAGRRERLSLPGPQTRLVAVRGGVIAGFVQFGPKRGEVDRTQFDEQIGEIYAIYVHPEFWGTGVAGELLRTALESLPQQEVQLWMLEANERGRRFYARYGLHPDGARDVFQPRGSDFEAPDIRLSIRRDEQHGQQ